MATQVHHLMDENEMVLTFIETHDVLYYENVLVGIEKPFSEMIKHEDMVEIRMQSRKIKDFSALKALVEYL